MLGFKIICKLSTATILMVIIVIQNWAIAWNGVEAFHNQVKAIDEWIYGLPFTER